MACFKSILVPTDFSENAAAAFVTATKLAADLGATIRVANVVPASVVREAIKTGMLTSGDDDATIEQKVHDDRARRMDAFLAPFGETATGVEHVFLKGKPAHEIVRYAKENGIDLIVMGRRGVTLADVILGSVAENVIRHAHCPVMIAKRPSE